MPQFFVSCPLNFEKELVLELQEVWMEFVDLDGLPTRNSAPEFEILQGGVEFEAPEHIGYQINLFSKLANRVLIRITKFECRYFDQFEKNIDKIKFSNWLNADTTLLNIKVESVKSRLNNQKNLAEAFTNSLKRQNFKTTDSVDFNSKNMTIQNIFIRGDHDKFTISLDTGGEHLHRRGYALHRGEAPLRETLAAFLVRAMFRHVNSRENLIVLDLFAGSGTLLFESLIQRFPNFSREYSFTKFANCPKLFKSDSWRKNFRWIQNDISDLHLVGVDRDAKTIQAAESNLDFLKKQYDLENLDVNFFNDDSEKIDLKKVLPSINNAAIWCICNPPYGIRLSDESALKVLHTHEKSLNGLVIIHPHQWKFNFNNLKLVEQSDFNNQGLDLKLSIFKTF